MSVSNDQLKFSQSLGNTLICQKSPACTLLIPVEAGFLIFSFTVSELQLYNKACCFIALLEQFVSSELIGNWTQDIAGQCPTRLFCILLILSVKSKFYGRLDFESTDILQGRLHFILFFTCYRLAGNLRLRTDNIEDKCINFFSV